MTINEKVDGVQTARPFRIAADSAALATISGSLSAFCYSRIDSETRPVRKVGYHIEGAGFGIFAALLGAQAVSLLYRGVRQAYRKVNE